MTTRDDHELLAQYARGKCETAFAELVERHINLVYSAALRVTANPHHAQEITQAVFVVLARKAGSLRPGTVLSGWLYQTARLTAANFVRGEIRRQRREQEAYMQSNLTHPDPEPGAWRQIAPLLDEALGRLGETDRNAIVLRFFENKSGPEVAAALKLTDAAAHKRVSRALEKLRRFFRKRGVTLSAAGIASALVSHSIQAAPAGLSAATIALAAAGTAVGTSVGTLAVTTLRLMTWLKLKAAVGVAAALLLVGGPVAVVLWHSSSSAPAPAPGAAVAATLPANPASAEGVVLAEEPVVSPREPMTEGAFMSLDTPPGGLAEQPDGKIIVGASLGGFYIDPHSGRLGQFERGAFRLNPDGSWDRTFCSRVQMSASDAHRAHVAIQPDGSVVMSGLFDGVDGQSRPGYTRLRPDGGVDDSFVPWQGSTNSPARTYLPGGTYPAAALSDGSVAVMSGALEGRMAPYPLTVYRLAGSGKLIAPAQSTLAGGQFSRPSGLILTLGPVGFWARKAVEWNRSTPARRHTAHFPPGFEHAVADLPFDFCDEPPAAVDAAPVLAALFEEVPIELCRYAAPLPDGGIVLAIRSRAVGGSMTGYGGFMRFDKSWQPDLTFTNWYEADLRSCLTLKRQADGKFLVAGLVGKMNGTDVSGLVRLSEDGQTDPSFHCETGSSWQGRVMDFVVQTDGRIVICGFFTSVNGVPCQHLARVNPDGSLDRTFKNPFVSLEKLNAIRFPVHHLVSAAVPGAGASSMAAGAAEAAPETILITSMTFQSDGAAIRFTGTPRKSYVLQAKDSLADKEWQDVSTSQANAGGTGFFRDAGAKEHPARFYRVAAQ